MSEAARRGRRQLADDAARAAEAAAVLVARAVVVGERAPDDVLLAEAALARWSRSLRGA